MTEPTYTPAVKAADLAREASVAVEIAGKPILICHSKGEYFAVLNRCTHADERLDCGRVRGGWVACPGHGARFDLATGRAMNPPATLPIATCPTRLVGEWVEVGI
jgi:3-phenylpropionate/trans-cinnamate dioxygenase ferredoxin subunit